VSATPRGFFGNSYPRSIQEPHKLLVLRALRRLQHTPTAAHD
jgi:hypothetical protein